MAHRETNPFRERRYWWTAGSPVAFIAAYALISAVCIYWMVDLGFPEAAWISGIFWVIMFPVVVLMLKRALIEPTTYIHDRTVDRTRDMIADQRRQVRKEFIQTELDALGRGEAGPVLDIWHLDPRLEGRHPYFACLETVRIDPTVRELWMRLQIGELERPAEASPGVGRYILDQFAAFLRIMADDGYFRLLSCSFDTVAVEICSVREGEDQTDVPYVLLSVLLNLQIFRRISAAPQFAGPNVATVGDLRFANGAPVEPHRNIPAPLLRGK